MSQNQKVLDVIAETRAMLQQKTAKFAEKKALAGKDPSSYPGAEHDSPSNGDGSSDKETKDTNWLPKGTLATEGAGDDSKITRGHATDATQPSAEPTAKPVLSTDINAKTAGMADDLLLQIRAFQKSSAAAVASLTPAAPTPPAAPAAPATTKVAAPVVPAATKVAEPVVPAAPAAPATEKAATGFNMELSQAVLAKMAAIALATEEGVAFMESQLSKAAGATAAAEMLEFIQQQDAEAEKAAAFAAGSADADALIRHAAAEKSATRVEKVAAALRKIAEGKICETTECEVGGTKPSPKPEESPKKPEARVTDKAASAYYKLGQEMADASIAAGLNGELGGAPAGMMPGSEGLPPEAAGGLPPEGMPPEGGEGGEDISEEELAQVLQELVADGTINEQDLAQILQALEGGEGGEAPPEGGEAPPAPPEGGEAAPKEPEGESKPEGEAAGEDASEDKLASAKKGK